MVIFGSPKTLGHSPKARLVVTMIDGALIETADQMEQQLPAGLGEGEIAEFVEDDEVEAREVIGESSLAAGAGFRASSWLTRSTVVKKRPRDPARMQLRAMAMARCVLPVPGETATWRRASGE